MAMLMAEIERTEHGDTGKARAWTLRAVRALHDPAWTADGYVSASLATGVAGHRPARCVSVADAGRGVAVRQERCDGSSLFEEEIPAPSHEPPARLPAEIVRQTGHGFRLNRPPSTPLPRPRRTIRRR